MPRLNYTRVKYEAGEDLSSQFETESEEKI